ncbi:hypothetical protein S83_063482 [Arachis hypogaea]
MAPHNLLGQTCHHLKKNKMKSQTLLLILSIKNNLILIPIQTYWTSLMCLRYRSSQMQILPQLQLFHLLKLIFVHLATLESGDIPDIRHEQLHEMSTIQRDEPHNTSGKMESKQFVPFISPPLPAGSYSTRHSDSPPPMLSTKTEANVNSLSSSKSEANVDLQDVLAASHAATKSAECATAAARSAASLAQVRISELTRENSEQSPDSSSVNAFYAGDDNQSTTERGHLAKHNSRGTSDGSGRNTLELNQDHFASDSLSGSPSFPSFDTLKADFDSSLPKNHSVGEKFSPHQPNRLPSLDDDPYFSYPNLFSRHSSNVGSQNHHSDSSRSTHDM